MKLATLQVVISSAFILFSAHPSSAASHGHRRAHDEYAKRHSHRHQPRELVGSPKAPRKPTCSLPDDPDLVRVPGAKNNGFAMSPDEACEDGKWCPFACVPGKVMAQWKPNTTYSYPESMHGGLDCNDGKAEKPFEDEPYCMDGAGTVKAVNKAGKIVSFCQTVLPGNEAMLIPTDVSDAVTLSVPGPSYWAGTSAHYYINGPGIPASKGCVWGKISESVGNWSPYVAGANTMSNGETFVKIAWNPEFLSASYLAKTKPAFGVKIECPNGGCNGLPCTIDPSRGGVGDLQSPVSAKGVGDANFCVVTVPKGKSANIVVFSTDGSDDSNSSTRLSATPTKTKASTVVKPTKQPLISFSPSSSSSLFEEIPATSSASPSTASDIFIGGLFQEQEVHGETKYDTTLSITPQTAPTQAPDVADTVSSMRSNEGAASEGNSAIAGLAVALLAAAALI